MQRGAMDYLTKPIELADLGRAVQRALKRGEMLLENHQLNQWLKEEVSTRTAELQRERMKLERLSIATLEALVNALEANAPACRGLSPRGRSPGLRAWGSTAAPASYARVAAPRCG